MSLHFCPYHLNLRDYKGFMSFNYQMIHFFRSNIMLLEVSNIYSFLDKDQIYGLHIYF